MWLRGGFVILVFCGEMDTTALRMGLAQKKKHLLFPKRQAVWAKTQRN